MTDIIVGKLEVANRETTAARMALAAQERQTELLPNHLNQVSAERSKLEQEKFILVEDNAVLKERSLASGTRVNLRG